MHWRRSIFRVGSWCGVCSRGGVGRGGVRWRGGGVSNAQYKWTVIAAVHFVADDTITNVLYQPLGHNKVVKSPEI